VRASLVGDSGQVRLVLISKETGAANAFQVEADAGLAALAFSTQQNAQDAIFSVNGLTLSSSSNVIRDAIQGVTLTLTKAPPAGSPPDTTVDGEVAVEPDSEKIETAVQEFVKAYNDLGKLVAELTKYDPNTKTAAILNGESVLRRIQFQVSGLVRDTMTVAAGDFSRLSQIGISVQADGTLKLDEGKLGELAAADPTKLSRLFTATSAVEAEQGFAVRLRTVVKAIIEPEGTLESRQEGLRASIRTLDQQQERMEARLALIESRLRRQYSQLDALLTGRQSQSNALANALAGLPTLKDE
jgi:flagellar hook-associated protein 2